MQSGNQVIQMTSRSLRGGGSAESTPCSGTELTPSDSPPEGEAAACSCLSCQDKCQSWAGDLLASSSFPPFSSQLISAGPGLVLFTRRMCSQPRNSAGSTAYYQPAVPARGPQASLRAFQYFPFTYNNCQIKYKTPSKI